MVGHHRLMTWSFLLIFVLMLYQDRIIEASAEVSENNLELNDRVSKLESHDRHQDGEVSLLKIALNEERKFVHDLISRVADLEDSNKILGRPKRPVRLLPPHVFRGKDKDKKNEEENIHRFYGPATGCNELGKLGYTLNGYYLVHGKDNQSPNSNSNHQIEVVECRFLQKPKLENQTAEDKETRLGFIKIIENNNGNSNKPHCLYQLKNNRQICLAVAESKSGSITTTKNSVSYLAPSPCDSKREEQHWMKSENHVCNNKNDKCLTVSQNMENEGVFVTLTPYKPSAKNQQWKSNSTNNGFTLINNEVFPLCLFNSANGNETKVALKESGTQLKRCDSNSPNNFFFELINQTDRSNCIPIEYSNVKRNNKKKVQIKTKI